MPLSEPAARQDLHRRRYDFRGYRREDGLWDIEGHMTDVKSYAFDNDYRGKIQPGEPLHDMWIRLTLDDELVVQRAEAATEAGPFAICPDAAPKLARLAGVKIGKGWRRAINEKLGGVEGCTHLREMLGAMATVAYQSILPVLARERKRDKPGASGRPRLLDSCHAFRSDGPVVKKAWPDFYTGE